MKPHIFFSCLVLPLALVVPLSTVQAQSSPSDVANAKALQAEGLKLLDKGNADGALKKFDQAFTLVPSAKVQFNQGRAHEALGHDIEALSAYQAFLDSPQKMPQVAREDAQRRVDRLRLRIAFLDVTGPSGAEVLLDQAVKGTLPMTTAIALTPGLHEVRLQRDGQELHRQTLDARAGATINVNVVLQTQTTVREPSATVVQPQAPADNAPLLRSDLPKSEAHDRSWIRTTAWVTGGLAVGALVFGGIEQWRASSKANEFNDYRQAPQTGDGRCGEAAPEAGGGDCQSLLDASDSAQRVAVGAFITGAVLAAGSAGLFMLSPSASPQGSVVAWICTPDFIRPGAACTAHF
jgi:hypothetical protein